HVEDRVTRSDAIGSSLGGDGVDVRLGGLQQIAERSHTPKNLPNESGIPHLVGAWLPKGAWLRRRARQRSQTPRHRNAATSADRAESGTCQVRQDLADLASQQVVGYVVEL